MYTIQMMVLQKLEQNVLVSETVVSNDCRHGYIGGASYIVNNSTEKDNYYFQ